MYRSESPSRELEKYSTVRALLNQGSVSTLLVFRTLIGAGAPQGAVACPPGGRQFRLTPLRVQMLRRRFRVAGRIRSRAHRACPGSLR